MELVSSHPAAYDLDCYHVQALDGERRQEVRRHVESCDRCRAYLAELDAQREALHKRLPAQSFFGEVGKRAGPCAIRTSLIPAWGFALAGLVVLGLLAFFSWPAGTSVDEVRIMGGFQVHVFVERGEAVEQVVTAARVSEGDAVRFCLVSPRPAYVAVFFMEDSGKVSWYLPGSGSDAPLEIAAGETTLPASARFDASTRNERAFVIRSAEPFVPGEVAGRVQDAWRRAGSVDFSSADWLAGFQEVESVVFEKK
ncbi:MAG: hypothetical protein JXR96_10700 [Deltaproteobacteria bacterium]|nr:hypothetical protein [Deltaproteobacteria bacterium]